MSLKPCSIGVPGRAEAFVAQSVGARKMTAMKESRACLDFVFVICIVLSVGRRGGAQENIFPCDSWHALAVMYPSRAHDTALAAKRCHTGVRDLSFLNRGNRAESLR